MTIHDNGVVLEPTFQSSLALHDAAANYEMAKLKQLLEQGQYNPHQRNGDGQTALHVLLSDEFGGHYFQSEMEECLRLLIGAGGPDLINALDNKGESSISLAVHHRFQSAALELVRNGADTTIMTGKFPGVHSLASKIAKTMPQVMKEILDSGIVPNGKQGQLANVTLEWGKLLQYPPKDGVSLPRETSFLYSLLNHPISTRGPYLKHPLVSAFLHLRVNQGPLGTVRGNTIYWYQVPIPAWLILYVVFIYLSYFKVPVSKCEEVGSGPNCTEAVSPGDKLSSRITNPPLGITTCAIILFLLMAVVGLADIFMLFAFDLQYLKSWRMWVIRIAYCFMGTSLWGPIVGALRDNYDPSWVYPVTAMGIFFAWALLLLQVELFFPQLVKLYVEMLAAIAISVLKTILLFFLLFFGFYEGFRLMYGKPKTLVEFLLIAFDVTSISSEYEVVSGRCKGAKACSLLYWYNVFSSSFRIVFIVVVGIVFINFLIGVAISDFQKLKQGAEIRALSSLLQNVFIVNIFFPERFNVVSRRDRENKKWTCTYHPSKGDCPERAKFSEEIRMQITEFLKDRKLLELERQREANNNNTPFTME